MGSYHSPHDQDSATARLDLITRNLPECPGRDEIRAILDEGRDPKGVWVTVPTGRPHLGYFVPMIKMVDFLRAGVDMTVCLGDLYAFLINFKYPLEQVMQRKIFYQRVLSGVMETIGALPASAKLRFRAESSYVFSQKHMVDQFNLCALASQHDIRQTGEEVGNSTMFGPMLTPGLQALDEEYQGSDFDFGGLDQRGLFTFAEKFLPKLGYRKRAHLMNDMLIGLNGGKMSASLPDSKIDCLDSPETVRRKISEVRCAEGEVHENGLLAIVRLVLFPISELRVERLQLLQQQQEEATSANLVQQEKEGKGSDPRDLRPLCSEDAPDGTKFSIDLGGDEGVRHYTSYEEVEQDYAARRLGSAALKEVVASGINSLLVHIHRLHDADEEWRAAEKVGYPETEDEFLSTHQAGRLASSSSSTEAVSVKKAEYDMNFCLPLRALSNDLVKLVPFIPAIHASPFYRNSQTHQATLWSHLTPGPFTSQGDFEAKFIDGIIQPDRSAATFAIIDRTRTSHSKDDEEGGVLAGMVSLLNTSPSNMSTEIGYFVLLPSFQHTHVSANAVGLLLEHALAHPSEEGGGMGMRRVGWQASSANQAGQRLAEKMGFQKEGVLRNNLVFHDVVLTGKVGKSSSQILNGDVEKSVTCDTVIYSLCVEDWEDGGVRDEVHAALVKSAASRC